MLFIRPLYAISMRKQFYASENLVWQLLKFHRKFVSLIPVLEFATVRPGSRYCDVSIMSIHREVWRPKRTANEVDLLAEKVILT